jgi:hypothetical protein
MRLFHITSASNALNIIRTQKFVPKSLSPYDNDNGINCFNIAKKTYNFKQIYENQGAHLLLFWAGVVANTSVSMPPPLPSNIAHEQGGWRCFIRGPIGPAALQVVGIRFLPGILDEVMVYPKWHMILPTKIRYNLARSKKLKFLKSLREHLNNNAVFISIES